MAKGQKICKACGAINGCRSYKCGSCQAEFISNKLIRSGLQKPKKKNRKWKRVLDWTELKKGDKIKVVGGGMSYANKDETSRYKMGYKGLFSVSYLDNNGIHAYGNPKEGSSAHCFLRMIVLSPTNPNLPGVIVRPYRLRKWVGDEK